MNIDKDMDLVLDNIDITIVTDIDKDLIDTDRDRYIDTLRVDQLWIKCENQEKRTHRQITLDYDNNN